MARWTERDEERVSPTARWIFRGGWTLLLVVFLVLLASVVVTLLARLVT